MQRLLITGASGYLGSRLCELAAERFQVTAVVFRHSLATPRCESLLLDLTDAEAVARRITELRPFAIVHAAAVNPGGEEQAMWRVNRDGSAAVARAAHACGARLVHVSSDVVHSGRNGPYSDAAEPTPINAYGETKAAGEREVRCACPAAAIVRTSLIYGLTAPDRVTEGFLRSLTRGEPLRLFSDSVRQPVWIETLCEALLKLVAAPVSGTLNVAGGQVLSREEFGRRLLQYWNAPNQHLIQSCRAADVAPRMPLDLRLHIKQAEQSLGMTFPGVDTVLQRSGRRPSP